MTRHILLLGLLLTLHTTQAFQDINAFVYHRFGDDRYPSTNIDLDKFEAHLKYLKDQGYRVVTVSEAIALMDKKRVVKDKLVAITIDDGFKSFYQNGLPLLKKYGFKATLYVNSETVGAGDYMSWEEITDAQQQGVEIGNHSHGHHYFLNEDIQTFVNDLMESERLFKLNLQQIPKSYAYPYGEWNQQMAYVLDTAGYHSGMAQNSGVIGRQSNRFYLPRFPMSNAYAAIDKFIEKLNVKSLNNFDVEIIKSGYMGSTTQPRLLMKFASGSYEIRTIQGFIQGSKARKTVEVLKDGVVKLTLWPENELNRRRTLFTVTAQDNSGQWYWFSYLYVRPDIEEL